MTNYTIALDNAAAGWKTVEWVDANLITGSDHVRLITVSEFYGESLNLSEDRLEAAAQMLLSGHPGLPIELNVTGGPTVDRLISGSAPDDVLVIGGDQTHRFLASLSGRAAERIVAHATTPVVVVPERWVPNDGPITVGVDSRTAASALAFAADTAARSGRDLVLARAFEMPSVMSPYGRVYLEKDRKLWEHESQLELDAAIRAVSATHPDLRMRGELHEGNPGAVLLRPAYPSSLVIVGRRHRTAIGAFLQGSVGEALMHEGTAPVCVVPPMAPVPVRETTAA